MPARPSSDVAFTDAVKALQTEAGSRSAYARMEARGGFATDLTEDVAAFIEAQTSVFLATCNAAGQPYVQHRGGPPGFLAVLDPRTLAFAERPGNRQFITAGNLSENPKAHLFLLDYGTRTRVKVWAEASVRTDDELAARLRPSDGGEVTGQVVVLAITAWDANCPKYIPTRFEAEAVREALASRDARIAELERTVAALRTGGAS